jgi:SAM-dependent methyltransferase
MTGVEPSADASRAAAARGVDARVGTLADVALEQSGYDFALFNHSLEHVEDPVADLGRAAAALKPGGVLLVTVPNFGGWQARSFRSRWFHLDLPRHRVHFTREGLARALERAGLEGVELRTSSSSVGLAGSLQYRVAGRCLFPAGMGLRVAVAASVALVPVIWLLDRVLGEGDLLHAVARKPER